jgi:hypothetical protein
MLMFINETGWGGKVTRWWREEFLDRASSCEFAHYGMRIALGGCAISRQPPVTAGVRVCLVMYAVESRAYCD